MRIGILGGTFDPPHQGHVRLAETALAQLGLDEVLLVPAWRNPLKKSGTPAKHRLQMVNLAIQGLPRLAASNIEIVRQGPSYAVDTLAELQFVQPAEYWFILGADALREITKWKNPEKLVKMCRLGVALRAGQSRDEVLSRVPGEFHALIDWIDMERIDVSGTDIRERLSSGRSVRGSVHPAVLEYIETNKLYRS